MGGWRREEEIKNTLKRSDEWRGRREIKTFESGEYGWSGEGEKNTHNQLSWVERGGESKEVDVMAMGGEGDQKLTKVLTRVERGGGGGSKIRHKERHGWKEEGEAKLWQKFIMGEKEEDSKGET